MSVPKLIRPLLLSVLLGLLEAMRRAEDPLAAPLGRQWNLRAPLHGELDAPARCWFWAHSPLAN